jgi:flagellar basal body P-ring formation protein FlgA
MTRLIILAALAMPGPVLAQSTDLAAIDTEVARFTGSPVGAPGGAAQPVDRRLRLRPCPGPLALQWYGLRRDTVQVSCPVPGGWRIYVPLTAGSQSEQMAPLVTKGDAVTVIVSGQGFAVSQQGEALEGGGAGEWIKVRLGRGEPLRARVLRPGAVGIVLP